MKILITAALTAKAAQLQKKLQQEGNQVILGDSNLPEFMLGNPSYIRIPPFSDPSFVHKVLTTGIDLNIEKIWPLKPEEEALFQKAKVLFEEYGIEVVEK